MINKTFLSQAKARQYFNRISETYVCFFIHNREDNVYEVVNQDLIDHYDEEFDLDYELIDMYA